MASEAERARRSMGTPKWPLNREAYSGSDKPVANMAEHIPEVGKMVLVPVDPTTEMIGAATRVDFDNEDEVATTINLWHAMLSAAPQPSMEGEVDRLARFIAETCYGYSWDGLGATGRVTDRGFKPFHFKMQGGMSIQGTQNDLRDIARQFLESQGGGNG